MFPQDCSLIIFAYFAKYKNLMRDEGSRGDVRNKLLLPPRVISCTWIINVPSQQLLFHPQLM